MNNTVIPPLPIMLSLGAPLSFILGLSAILCGLIYPDDLKYPPENVIISGIPFFVLGVLGIIHLRRRYKRIMSEIGEE